MEYTCIVVAWGGNQEAFFTVGGGQREYLGIDKARVCQEGGVPPSE